MPRVLDIADRPRRRLRVCLYVAAAVVAIAALPYATVEAYRAYLRLDPEWRFVEEVILQPAPGGARPMVIRWTTSPRIALVNAVAEDDAFVRTVLPTLNEVLDGSGVSLRLAAAGEGDVQLYFAKRPTFERLARNFEAEPFPPVAGFHLIWPGERFDVATAVAVVSAELGDAERRAAIVHQLLHVLGLRGDSGVFPESATFSEAERRSTATALAPIDRRLLRLLYMNLEPADGWSELRAAYRRYWHAS